MAKLTYGIAYNSKGAYKAKEGGRITKAYDTWKSMVRRCYSAELHEKEPTYIGCKVDEDWLDFQCFATWFYSHQYSEMGYHLDKDLLVPNSKLYSAETCCFIPQQINKIIKSDPINVGIYPRGVHLHKKLGKYRARLSVDGVLTSLGLFDCPQDAHNAYRVAKKLYVKDKALEWQDRISDDVFQALINWEL